MSSWQQGITMLGNEMPLQGEGDTSEVGTSDCNLSPQSKSRNLSV